MDAKTAFKTLEKMVGAFSKFEDQPLDQFREELYKTVKKFESGEYGWKFYRKDDKETKVIQLWAYEEAMKFNMTPDFEIGVRDNKMIWVQNDILWKTLYGIKEQIAEESAYQHKYERD